MSRAALRTRLPSAILLLASNAALAAGPADFAYAWPLATSGDSSAYQFELTPEVYAALVDPALRDLAVFNAADEAVPLQAVMVDAQTVYHEERITLPSFAVPRSDDAANRDDLQIRIERDAAGHLRRLDSRSGEPGEPATRTDYLLDASALDRPIESLWLQHADPAGALNAQFAIEGSDDLQHWRSLVDAASVLDLREGEATLRRQQIVLPAQRATYLRLRRLDGGATPAAGLQVEARLLARSSEQATARRWIELPPPALTVPSATTMSAPGQTPAAVRYDYALPGALTVEALRLNLASDNSIAEITAFARLGGGTPNTGWSQRARFTAFRLRQDGAVLGNDEIAIGPGSRTRAWRIESAQPLSAAPALSVAYRPDRFVFLAQGAGPYRLVAGQREARYADAPVAAALAQLRARLGADWQPPLLTLGARQTLRGADATAAPAAPVEAYPWKSWLLWLLLIGGAAAVAVMAVQLLRERPQPPP